MLTTDPTDTTPSTRGTSQLTDEQMAAYDRDGFLVMRGAIPEDELCRVEAGLDRYPPDDGTLVTGPTYPEPGRYTLANNCLKDPDLAFMAEHDTIVGAAADVLRDDPRLTAYVAYNRTPGGAGLPSHNDYKRWRPVGSSMNWVFTTIPLCDYDDAAGQLFVSPGSHRLDRIHRGTERPLEVDPAIKPADDSYIDPELKRGDLLLMNMHTWHRAAGNTSNADRVGLFNKYTGVSTPPATGYLVYDEDVYIALSPEGRSVIEVHSDLPVGTTRAVLTRDQKGVLEVLVTRDADGRLGLPGGQAVEERAIPDWDHGNYIASLQTHLRNDIKIETPWLSYAGDYEEGPAGAPSHLCRVYGYDLPGLGFPVPYQGATWLSVAQLSEARDELRFGYEADAVAAWLDPAPTRGKGVSQAQSRINQYAY